MKTPHPLLLLTVLAVAVAVGQQAPCIPCQNGGVCNRTKLQSLYGDVYGTCVCPSGYSGTSCETNVALTCSPACTHNGSCVGGRCVCDPLTLGSTCDTIACGFQQGLGTGAANATYPDARGQCGACDDAHNGPYCRNVLQCPNDLVLTKGVIGVGTEFTYSCADRSSDLSWAQLIQGYTTVLIHCVKASKWENSTAADGSCTVNFMRESYVSHRREELFSCSMSNCFETVKRTDESANPTYDLSHATIAELPASVAFRVLIALSALSASAGVLVTSHRFIRLAFWTSIMALTLNCVVYCAAVVPATAAAGSETVQRITSSGAPRPVAEVQCGTITCACNYLISDQPNCNLPTFAQYLQGLSGTSKLTCDNTTNTCVFSNANFFQGTVQLAFGCNVSSCTDYTPTIQLSTSEISETSTSSSLGAAIAALAGVLIFGALLVLMIWCVRSAMSKPQQQTAPYVAHERTTLSCQGISYGADKLILDSVSGTFDAAGIIALLGPSGAGKSTFLDILGFREKEHSLTGVVSICGIHEPAWKLRRCISYANDGPCFIDVLTVRETLLGSCRLRSPKNTSSAEIEANVEWLITVFRLEAVADTKVERLSAGETRRLRVAVALSGFPSVLLLDEPTSGLDSLNARLVLQTLRTAISEKYTTMSRQPPVTIVTVHQPSPELLTLFDQIAIMGRGKLAFKGTADELKGWIEMVEPARPDLAAQAIELVTENENIVAKYVVVNTSTEHSEEFATSLKRLIDTSVPPHQQVIALVQRNMTTLLRKPGVVCLHFLISTVVALALSFMYQDVTKDATGIVAKAGLVSFNFLWISLTQLSVMDVIYSERATVVSDRHHSLYSSVSYLSAKAATDVLILRLLPTVVGTCLIYFPTGFRMETSAFFAFLGVQILFTLCMTAIATCFAAQSRSFGVATLGYGFVVILAFAFGGFVSQGGSMPVWLSWISYLSPFYLGFNVIMTTDLEQQLCIFTPRDASGSPTSSTLTLACSQYLFTLDIKPSEKDLNAGLLALWSLIFLIGATVCVEFMFHVKR